MTFDIKHFAMQDGNAWFRSGWPVLVEAYRNYQKAVQECGTAFGEGVATDRARFDAALEVLVRQTADALAVPAQDAHPEIKGYLYEVYGLPENPKNLDAWLEGR